MNQSPRLTEYRSTPQAVLIATLGSEPQVVTAALDLLLQQGEPIQTVHVTHTLHDTGEIAEGVQRLQEAFQTSPYLGNISLELHPLLDTNGVPLLDVETLRATEQSFRLLYRLVRRAKLENQRVHFSIAGGRKSMGIFGMTVAQMLFDDGDRLWHLYSAGDFMDSKRLHPLPGEQAHLIPIPVILWSQVSPALTELGDIDDPFMAVDRLRSLRLAETLERSRGFVLGVLSHAEEAVVCLLVQEGLSDAALAERLVLSPRTVEQHLRSAYHKAAAHWELKDVNRAVLVSLLGLYYATR